MKGFKTLSVALAMAGTLVPGIALADDPNDPAMRNRAARAKDAAITRQLNTTAFAHVRDRDARYDREAQSSRAAMLDYERRMAAWRQAVDLCRQGHTEHCAR